MAAIYDLPVTANPGDSILIAQNIPGMGLVEFMTVIGDGIEPGTAVSAPVPTGPDALGNWVIYISTPTNGAVTTATFTLWELLQVG